MARIFDIFLYGTSPGPYTVYYDAINVNNIATLALPQTPAINIPYISLTTGTGVRVSVPDSTVTIYLYNQTCQTYFQYTPNVPTPTRTPRPTPTPTKSVTPTPSITASNPPTPTPTKSVTPTPTITPTVTQSVGYFPAGDVYFMFVPNL